MKAWSRCCVQQRPRLPQVGKPETFQFLGFTFICGQSRRGHFLLKRKSRGDRMRTKLKEVKEEMRWRRHQPVREQGKWLGQVVRGFFAYHAMPSEYRSPQPGSSHRVLDLWRRSLKRRSRTGPDHLGTDSEAGGRLPPETPHPSSLAFRAVCRHSPEVGAECLNGARSDLCGGAEQ